MANNQSVTSAVHDGLESIAKTAAEMAEHLRHRPTDLGAITESMESVSRQLTDLSAYTSQCVDVGKQVKDTVAETVKAGDWMGGQFCSGGNQCVAVGNGALGRVADF